MALELIVYDIEMLQKIYGLFFVCINVYAGSSLHLIVIQYLHHSRFLCARDKAIKKVLKITWSDIDFFLLFWRWAFYHQIKFNKISAWINAISWEKSASYCKSNSHPLQDKSTSNNFPLFCHPTSSLSCFFQLWESCSIIIFSCSFLSQQLFLSS